ncbi:hypothetical protein M758_2G109000 [Ceratodon purpureus]|nr:hypothetical protein M758_2G109000 [Ceratodon purpureus]
MSGFYFVVVRSDGELRQAAPLQSVAVTGLIRDAVAEYTMIQTFVNPLPKEFIDGAYTFPLYEGVAVTGFQAEVGGRKIVGKVAEKVVAREEYEEAVREGKTASLLEQEKPDVFQASIGNIPPGKTISICITLVSEMKHDAGENQVRFVLPTTVAPRHDSSFNMPDFSGRGFVRYPNSSSHFSVPASKLSINMACVMSKPITSVQSPSHTIEVHVGTTETTGSLESYTFDPNRARVSLTEDALLDCDLVIIIQSRGLDQPCVLVEHHPKDQTYAISLTFQPRFTLKPLQASELVFLVDVRSKSMLTRAGEALELFLRYIPFENHYFNVMGRSTTFGSSQQALFPTSVEFCAESLREGVKYAQKIKGYESGIEIGSAFQEISQRRRRDVPTQIFLLTDGQISEIEQLRRAISNAVDDGGRSNQPFRVFSLGIGDSVSHHLIQSVARAGRGYAQLVMAGERMEKKVFNMLKAGLMPPVTDTTIQWTDSIVNDFVIVGGEDGADDDVALVNNNASKPLINLFSDSESPPTVSQDTSPPEISATIYQAPFQLPILCPGARFTAYAILSPTIPLPKELILRGVSPDGPVELRVKIESVVEGETMLHSLAARALARDFEEASSSVHALGKQKLALYEKQKLKHLGVSVAQREGQKRSDILPLSFNHVAEITKQKLIDIGETYNLSTKYTSWVVIDEEGPRNARDVVPIGSYIVDVSRPLPPTPCFGYTTPIYGSSFFGETQAFGASTPAFGASTPAFGSSTPAFGAPPAPAFGAIAAPAFSGFGPAFSGNASSAPASGAPQGALFGAPSAYGVPFSSSTGVFGSQASPFHKAPMSPTNPQMRLQSLLQLQSFDGLFPLVPAIAALFDTSVDNLKTKLGELRKQCTGLVVLAEGQWEAIWATCLTTEFVKSKLKELRNEWEPAVEKAERRVAFLVYNEEHIARFKAFARAT